MLIFDTRLSHRQAFAMFTLPYARNLISIELAMCKLPIALVHSIPPLERCRDSQSKSCDHVNERFWGKIASGTGDTERGGQVEKRARSKRDGCIVKINNYLSIRQYNFELSSTAENGRNSNIWM